MNKISLARWQRETGVKFTLKHTAKMETVISLSTSPLCDLCTKRANNKNSICANCYSRKMMKRFRNLSEMLKRNDEILKHNLLETVPDLSKYSIVRFEAFGDIETEIQVLNYFAIAENNETTDFALWTKNPWIVEKAINEYDLVKPGNLKIIGSSWMLNKPMVDYYKTFDFIDNVFTVYNDKTVTINCGGLSCKDCGYKCYTGTHTNFEINEFIK